MSTGEIGPQGVFMELSMEREARIIVRRPIDHYKAAQQGPRELALLWNEMPKMLALHKIKVQTP